MKETSGRATEEGSLFQDGQTCNRYRDNATNHSLQVTLTESPIQVICKASGSRRRPSRTRHHQVVPEPHNFLSTTMTWKRAGHTRLLVIDRERDPDLQKYRYEEIAVTLVLSADTISICWQSCFYWVVVLCSTLLLSKCLF